MIGRISYGLVLISFTIISCEEPRDMDVSIEIVLAEKIRRYQLEEVEICKDKASEAAEAHVDSLISDWVAKQLVDTIKIPAKPVRPETPDAILGTIDTFIID